MKRPGTLASAFLLGSFVLTTASSQPDVLSQTIVQGPDYAVPEQIAATSPCTITGQVGLRILLVEFNDITCRKEPDGVTPRYTRRDFEDLLGSSGVYVSPGMRSPDGDELFGSLNDYYRMMSNGRIAVHAFVINREDTVTGRPVWLQLGHGKRYYNERLKEVFYDDVIRIAEQTGLDTSTSDDMKLAVIYTGNLQVGGLTPGARGNCYIMSELQGTPYNQENAEAKFARIGIHCHEFGHTIGIGHSSGSRADLMEAGTRNGSVCGNAPAPLNAIARMKKGWLDPIPISGTKPVEISLDYSMTEPMVVKMTNGNGEYFLVENRRFDQSMTIGGTTVPDYNNVAFFPPAGPHGSITQGIFVWRVVPACPRVAPGYSTEGLIYASGRFGRTFPENTASETDDGVPFPGVSGKMLLSPWSDPRNPCDSEYDYFGSGTTHYTLYVPNTKGGSSCAMEILSEDRVRGTFLVRFYPSDPPNPGLANLTEAESLGAYSSRHTLCRTVPGQILHVVEVGGEIFLRGQGICADPQTPVILSDSGGGNTLPCITTVGAALQVVWQRKTSCDEVYDIVSRRSTDLGQSWTAPEVLFVTKGDGGPVPTIAGSKGGSAILLFCYGSFGMFQMITSDGISWSDPVPGPPGVIDLASSTLGIDSTQDGCADGVLTYCAGTDQYRDRVWSLRYSFGSSSWGQPTCMSGTLPVQFIDHSNPNLICVRDANRMSLRVVWDATDTYAPGSRVVLSRAAGSGCSHGAYRILRGTCQEDIRVSDFQERLCGPGCAGCARVLNIIDTTRGAMAALEIASMRLIRSGREPDTLKFSEAPADSQVLDIPGLLRGGQSRSFCLPPDAKSIEIISSLYGKDPASLFLPASGCMGFEVVSVRSDSVIATLATIPAASIRQQVRKAALLSFPVTDLPRKALEQPVYLRPFIRGLRGDSGLTGLLGHVYSVKAEEPADTLLTGFHDLAGNGSVPPTFELFQNYPNPCNPATVIRYRISATVDVILIVYDILGREVAVLVCGKMAPGTYETRFNAAGLASGAYILRMTAGNFVQTKKMAVVG